MASEHKSVFWVTVLVMGFLAAAGWAYMAGSYEGAHGGSLDNFDQGHLDTSSPKGASRAGAIRLVFVAIARLPNFPAVIGWHLKHRIWLPLLFVGLECAAFGGGFLMKHIEGQLAKPYQSKQKRKIRMPRD